MTTSRIQKTASTYDPDDQDETHEAHDVSPAHWAPSLQARDLSSNDQTASRCPAGVVRIGPAGAVIDAVTARLIRDG
jgi:hypothetical protein